MMCFCPKCGAQNSDTSAYCSACGAQLADAATGSQPSPAVPPSQISGKATASLVLGILTFLTLGLAGIVAIVVGLLAKSDIRKSQGTLGGEGRALAGIVMGAIGMVAVFPICILVAIAVPNFLEAQVRAKVARTQADLRSLATAIEAYSVDHDTYPMHVGQLTTPLAYITAIPYDSVAPKDAAEEDGGRRLIYAPFNPEKQPARTVYHNWIVVGRGPDGEWDIDPAHDLPSDRTQTPVEVGHLIAAKQFDPTNGTSSAGDIIRVGSQNGLF